VSEQQASTDRAKDDAARLASNEEWQAWGRLDPLYGVAAIPGRADANPWTDEAFYEMGAIDWNLFRPKWEQYGVRRGSCVEIGCGAGRLTAHLARYFHSVHGLDVSAGMIEYARTHVPANVFLHLTNGLEIPLPADSADAVFSTHVSCSTFRLPMRRLATFVRCIAFWFRGVPLCSTFR
jgi:SAM-dependent methyltransferase